MAKKTPDEIREDVKKATSAISDAASSAVDAAKPVVEKARKAAAPTVKRVKDAAAPAAKKAAKAATTATQAVKDTAKKVTPSKPEYFVQFLGKEVNMDEIAAQAKAIFKEENKRAAVLSCRIYLKPEESIAYYVINDSFFGKLDI